jgi:hypothetical protein
LTREDWTKGNGTPPTVKGLIWFTDGSKMKVKTRAGVYGHSVRRRLQAEIYAILACVHEIKSHGRPEKHMSICSDCQAALKALQDVFVGSTVPKGIE